MEKKLRSWVSWNRVAVLVGSLLNGGYLASVAVTIVSTRSTEGVASLTVFMTSLSWAAVLRGGWLTAVACMPWGLLILVSIFALTTGRFEGISSPGGVFLVLVVALLEIVCLAIAGFRKAAKPDSRRPRP